MEQEENEKGGEHPNSHFWFHRWHNRCIKHLITAIHPPVRFSNKNAPTFILSVIN